MVWFPCVICLLFWRMRRACAVSAGSSHRTGFRLEEGQRVGGQELAECGTEGKSSPVLFPMRRVRARGEEKGRKRATLQGEDIPTKKGRKRRKRGLNHFERWK